VLSGPLRGLWWIPGSSNHACWLGTYERHVQRAATRLLRPGDIFFDIGANVGFFTLLASRCVGPSGRVVAFEPLPRNLECLQRHLDLNAMTNVETMPVAAADRSGEASFSSASGPSMGALAAAGTPVRIVSLDDLIRERASPPPRLLKIDVEGAESLVLLGASNLLGRHRPSIVLAAHGWRQYDECNRILKAAGYSLTLLRDGRSDGDYSLLAA
jgi:FkbM family methyltransferase